MYNICLPNLFFWLTIKQWVCYALFTQTLLHNCNKRKMSYSSALMLSINSDSIVTQLWYIMFIMCTIIGKEKCLQSLWKCLFDIDIRQTTHEMCLLDTVNLICLHNIYWNWMFCICHCYLYQSTKKSSDFQVVEMKRSSFMYHY